MNSKKLIPRGFLRSFVLVILKEKASHGYEIMEKINERTGFWRPSPGTIYPLLRTLKKEGLIEEIKIGSNRRTYKLTSRGVEIAAKVEQSERKIKEDVISLLAQVLNLEEGEIQQVARKFDDRKRRAKKPAKTALLPALHNLNKLSMRFLEQTEPKILRAAKILERANKEMKTILRS